MKLWPHDSFEINSPLTSECLVESLRNRVEPRKLLRFSRDHAEFQGTVSPDGFSIQRIIHYRNSFLPVIEGRFHRAACGTRVVVRMRLSAFAMAFLCVWLGVMGLVSIGMIGSLLLGPTTQDPTSFSFLPVLMAAIGWALAWIGFSAEARSQKTAIRELLMGLES